MSGITIKADGEFVPANGWVRIGGAWLPFSGGAPVPGPIPGLLGVGSASNSLFLYPKTGPVTTGHIWVDPKQSTNGNGSQGSPFNNLASAYAAVSDGERIIVRSGTLRPTTRFNRSQWWAQGIQVFAYGDERPVIDCSLLGNGDAGRVLNLYGRREHYKGFDIINGKYDNPVVDITGPGTEYKIEDCRAHHCLGDGMRVGSFSGQGAGGNLFQDCVVYRLGNGYSVGTDTGDAFIATASVGSVTTDNLFVRCVAAHGPDDNFDAFRGRRTRFIDCVSIGSGRYWNGNPGSSAWGDGAGFKMGGSDSDSGDNSAIGCVSVFSRTHGFTHNEARNDANSNPNIVFERCTSYMSGIFGFNAGGDNSLHKNRIRDCISRLDGTTHYAGANATHVFNTWNLGIGNPLFADVDVTDLSLAAGSAAIGAGFDGGNLGASDVALALLKEWYPIVTA